MFQTLNLPKAPLKIRNGKVWDAARKKYLKLTPEEWVRQHFIYFLHSALKYPKGLTTTEYKVVYAEKNVRADIVIFSKTMKPFMVIECKAPKVSITEDTFFQVAKYVSQLQPEYIVLTNGLNHVCAKVLPLGKVEFLTEVPSY